MSSEHQFCDYDFGGTDEGSQYDYSNRQGGTMENHGREVENTFAAARAQMVDELARMEERALMKEKLEDGREPLKPARDWEPLTTIKDSGERMQFASGSMRDPSTGKIDWTKITHGPMMRRWAQHLTAAEKKYPDPRPGVPNFTLIETEEERIRYKVSAFRHFMSWFYDEMDEDHAAAVFFNINGVEIIRDKQRKKEAESAESFYGSHTVPGVTKA